MLGVVFDFQAAKEIITADPRPVGLCELANVAHLVRRPQLEWSSGRYPIRRYYPGVGIDWQELDANPGRFDLGLPLILVTTPRRWLTNFPIHDWYRVAWAVENREEALPAVCLTPEETVSIMNVPKGCRVDRL
ncbi:MAG: hypothetical protein HY372_02435 [Candidatus Andersenbacteria bacterium]|nr:hypothetical protein [Candidatus Andersenbacteria bacterium]